MPIRLSSSLVALFFSVALLNSQAGKADIGDFFKGFGGGSSKSSAGRGVSTSGLSALNPTDMIWLWPVEIVQPVTPDFGVPESRPPVPRFKPRGTETVEPLPQRARQNWTALFKDIQSSISVNEGKSRPTSLWNWRLNAIWLSCSDDDCQNMNWNLSFQARANSTLYTATVNMVGAQLDYRYISSVFRTNNNLIAGSNQQLKFKLDRLGDSSLLQHPDTRDRIARQMKTNIQVLIPAHPDVRVQVLNTTSKNSYSFIHAGTVTTYQGKRSNLMQRTIVSNLVSSPNTEFYSGEQKFIYFSGGKLRVSTELVLDLFNTSHSYNQTLSLGDFCPILKSPNQYETCLIRGLDFQSCLSQACGQPTPPGNSVRELNCKENGRDVVKMKLGSFLQIPATNSQQPYGGGRIAAPQTALTAGPLTENIVYNINGVGAASGIKAEIDSSVSDTDINLSWLANGHLVNLRVSRKRVGAVRDLGDRSQGSGDGRTYARTQGTDQGEVTLRVKRRVQVLDQSDPNLYGTISTTYLGNKRITCTWIR